jgi:hypothetical protein
LLAGSFLQGRRDLPVEVVESHPSLGDNGTALPTPPATAISSRTSGTDSAACETCSIARSSTASDNACATCGTNTNIAHATTSSSSRDSYSAASAATVLQPNHPLMGLSDECGLCAAAPGALEHERQALLDKAAELERERAAHAAAAAEAEAMRARAAARAAELEVQLRSDVTSRRQQLMQQQEVSTALQCKCTVCYVFVMCYVHLVKLYSSTCPWTSDWCCSQPPACLGCCPLWYVGLVEQVQQQSLTFKTVESLLQPSYLQQLFTLLRPNLCWITLFVLCAEKVCGECQVLLSSGAVNSRRGLHATVCVNC